MQWTFDTKKIPCSVFPRHHNALAQYLIAFFVHSPHFRTLTQALNLPRMYG